MARNPYRDSMEKWKNFQPRSRRSFFPLKEGGEKKWNFQRRESWEERKKVSNCSRTLANWIKIFPACRSSDILGKLHGISCTGSFSLRALRRKRGRRKKTLLRARQLRILGRSWLPLERGRPANCNRPPHQLAAAPATVKMALLLPLHARGHNCSRTLENVTASQSR